MKAIAEKRFDGQLPSPLANDMSAMKFLAYAAFGIPRSLLNMLRSVEGELVEGNSAIERKKLLEAAKVSRENGHSVFKSLVHKIPAYKNFILTGDNIYSSLIESLKQFNRGKSTSKQGIEIGLKRPLPNEIQKLIGFYQYAGILMESGENSRGEKGVYDIYFLHFADLITENAIVGARTKSIDRFLEVFEGQKHQAWPRVTGEKLVDTEDYEQAFALSLPECQTCGEPRVSENAKYCSSCGAQLQSASIYHTLVGQDLRVLPITEARARTIRRNSDLRKIKDILMDQSKEQLRGVPQIGPKWAERILRYAEEYVA